MKYSFSNIPEGSSIILMLHNESVHMKMNASIINLIREDIAIISLDTSVTKVLKFDNMDIEVMYTTEDGVPFEWKKAKIVYFKNNYVLQVKGEGARYNRRCSYRVNIGRTATLRTDNQEYRVIVKDVSLTGFSVADKKNELSLVIDNGAALYFEDINHTIDLYGEVKRIEEKEDYKIYGFSIRRSCHDLPSYITTKLGDKSNKLPPSYVI